MSTATTSERRLLVVRHDHLSAPGPVADRFAEHGYAIDHHLVVPAEQFHTPGVTTEFPDFTRYGAVVVMGAPWSAEAGMSAERARRLVDAFLTRV